MQSRLDKNVVYPIHRGVAPHDYDTDAESWNYDGREVLRGTRDPAFAHDVYWLYNDDVERIGVAEHSTDAFHVLWYYECPFASFLQEDGWTTTDETIWTRIPSHVYEYCIDNSVTTVEAFQTLCKNGNWRVVTPECLAKNGKRYPDISKILFADHDCILYLPPEGSAVWSTLLPASGGSQAQRVRPVPQQAPQAVRTPPVPSQPVPQTPPREEHRHP